MEQSQQSFELSSRYYAPSSQVVDRCDGGDDLQCWIYDHLLPHAAQIKVAHPLMLRAIAAAKKKNDQIDASKLSPPWLHSSHGDS
jgi:hypothetical protein